MIIAVLLLVIVNLALGFFSGYLSRFAREQQNMFEIEKEIYCHGYEDGFYLGLGDYDPEMFRKEIAEKAYYEYRGIKHGPTKH